MKTKETSYEAKGYRVARAETARVSFDGDTLKVSEKYIEKTGKLMVVVFRGQRGTTLKLPVPVALGMKYEAGQEYTISLTKKP